MIRGRWAAEEAAEKLLKGSPAAVSGRRPPERVKAEQEVMQLCHAQQHLDALGSALQACLELEEPGNVRQAADMLWQRQGFEPIPPEKHDYSLLHAEPKSTANGFTHLSPAKMIPYTPDGKAPYDHIPRRHVPELVGFTCPVIDVGGALTPAMERELQKYLDIRAPMPVRIRNLPLFQRAVERWSIDYLAQHMGDQLYHTFASNQEKRKFGYFFECRNEGQYETPAIAEACKMTFQDFVRRQHECKDGLAYYLQTPVLRYEDGVITCAKFDEQMEEDLHTIDKSVMSRLSELGNFGPISRNQLFVSFSDYLTACHYDQQHNLFLQLWGAKRFLLFPPECFPALYPFPVHHPLDRKARVDLEDLDLACFPRAAALRGKGVEVVVEPGDVLFLPMSWFHDVHSIGPETVSLNFWFYDSGLLFTPATVLWPLTSASVLELARHVEYFVAEQLGPANVGAFFQWWLGGGSRPRDQVLADRWRLMRNYVLKRLVSFPQKAGKEVLAALDPFRWAGLRRKRDAEPAAASEGLRGEHKISELLQSLPGLSSSIFRCSMPAQAYRTLGRALDVLPRGKLRFFLECAEEVLTLVHDRTDWEAEEAELLRRDPVAGEGKIFSQQEALRVPAAQLRTLAELCDLGAAKRVKVGTVDNGFFANWLQVLDAALFAAEDALIEPDWVLTGQEREFNYGEAGEDLFAALFEEPVTGQKAEQKAAEQSALVVTHRYNFLLVNVFRGHFLRGPHSTTRRRVYNEAAKRVLRPKAAILKRRDEALAAVPRKRGAPLIGVHKRVDNPGTARMQLEQVMPSIEAYIEAAKRLAERLGHHDDAIFVLATDDAAAETLFQSEFPGRLICQSGLKRSAGGVNDQKLPREVHGQEGRLSPTDAEDCLVDALLLAACDAFIHADSNVTLAAGIMNPDSEAVHVRDLVADASMGGRWPGYRRCRLPL